MIYVALIQKEVTKALEIDNNDDTTNTQTRDIIENMFISTLTRPSIEPGTAEIATPCKPVASQLARLFYHDSTSWLLSDYYLLVLPSLIKSISSYFFFSSQPLNDSGNRTSCE